MRTLALAVWLAVGCSTVTAQVDRLELGLRLRTLERHLGAAKDEPRRSAALGQLDRAVQAFFRFDTAGVARAIAAAEEQLLGTEFTPAERFAQSVQLLPAARVVDLATGTVQVTLAPAYPSPQPLPTSLRLLVWFDAEAEPRLVVEVAAVPHAATVSIEGLPAGDHELVWELAAGDQPVLRRRQGLSLVDDLSSRLAGLEAALTDGTETSIEASTLPTLVTMLQTMTSDTREETVLPGARILAEAEQLAAAVRLGTPAAALAQPGEHWLRVNVGRRSTNLRLLVPAAGEPEAKQPLVLALHGAGGSENMFFDGYGDGALVRACAERGWFLAAPRSGLLGGTDLPGLVSVLAARWPIDTGRVFVVGHSMGAGQAIAAASRTPRAFAAVAALGGGGSVGRNSQVASLPFFIGVGSRDFARTGALALERSLVKAGAPAELREYPNVEHLAIVQFALPDLMAFFERAKPRR